MDWHTAACTIATLLRKERPFAALPAGFPCSRRFRRMEHQKGSSTQSFPCAVPVELQTPEPPGREEVRLEKAWERQVLVDASDSIGTCSNRNRNPRSKRRWLVKLRCFDEYKIQAHPMLKQVPGTHGPAKAECHSSLAVTPDNAACECVH